MLGVVTIVQAVPFHISAKVSVLLVEVLSALPVAMHHVGPVHETPANVAVGYWLGNADGQNS